MTTRAGVLWGALNERLSAALIEEGAATENEARGLAAKLLAVVGILGMVHAIDLADEALMGEHRPGEHVAPEVLAAHTILRGALSV
jgi:hypothetical protein